MVLNNHLSQICFLLGEEPSPGALHIVTKSNLAGSRHKYHRQTFLPYTVVKSSVDDVKACSICLCCRVTASTMRRWAAFVYTAFV